MRHGVRTILMLLIGLTLTMGMTAQAAQVSVNAGPDQNLMAGTVVKLDGSGSYDPKGGTLSYSWSFTSKPAASTAALSDSTAVTPTFTADIEGSYVVSLVVSIKNNNSLPDSVTITAYPPSTGTLDPTFGANGIYNGGPIKRGHSVAVQLDGKVLVAGLSSNSSNNDFLLERFNTNGTPDTTFGINGVATYDSGYQDMCFSVAMQPDGKALVAGYSYSNYNGYDNDFVLVRFNTDGTLDTSFGIGGVATYDSGNVDWGSAVTIQSDGKSLMAGYALNGYDQDFVLVRFNTDGTLDTTFGINGVATYDSGYNDSSYSVVLQSDGKALMVGQSSNGTVSTLVLVRLTTEGALDTAFGTNGVAAYSGNYGAGGQSVALQSDGKAVVSGNGSIGTSNVFLVTRFNTDGTLDTSFGTNGATYFAYGNTDTSCSVVIQPDNKAIVTGYSYSGTDYNLVLMRFNVDGTLDASFGTGGAVSINYGYYEYGFAVALQPDGKVLVAGQSFYYGLLLARFK